MMKVALLFRIFSPKSTLYRPYTLLFNKKTLCILSLMLLLGGCSIDFVDSDQTKTISYDKQKNAAYYLDLMEKSHDLSKSDIQLLAIRALLQEKRLQEAQTLLETLPPFLNSVQDIDKQLLLADLKVRQKSEVDLSHIDEKNLRDPQKNYFYLIKLRKDKQNNDINAIVRDYIALEKISPSQDRASVINNTWRYFKSLSDESLEKIIVFSHEITLKGWVDLNYIYRQAVRIETVPVFNEEESTLEVVTPTLSKAEQKERIAAVMSDWQKQYPSHPAALMPPKELQLSQKAPEIKRGEGKKVALLLPLSGSSKVFGDVVKAGYVEASKFYPDEPSQRVMVFDTSSDTLANLVSKAKMQGAELIVGPLLKEDVEKVTKLSGSLPVLALNKLGVNLKRSKSDRDKARVCYFGLSPEDEISGAVQHIYKQGKREPLILTSNTALGRRVAKIFAREWERRYSSPVYVQYFDSAQQLKEEMNRGRGLHAQGTRVEVEVSPFDVLDKRSLSKGIADIGAHSQTSAYTSGDIDAIYIFSTQDELEFIKPMLDMQRQVKSRGKNKRTLTLYTSSRSQNASGSPDYRYEMENVQFSDIPLLVSKNPVLSSLPTAIQRDYSLARLYAMGIDAWRLANRMDILSANKEPVFEGLTGIISVSERCNIDRELPWRVYKQGQVRSVND